MNINLKASVTSNKKGSTISYGLNKRGSAPKRKNPPKSIFQDDEDEESSSSSITGEAEERTSKQSKATSSLSTSNDKIRPLDARSAFNKELAAEQAAIRLRSERAMTGDTNVYDYDAEYESFSSGYQANSSSNKSRTSGQGREQANEKRESKYIQNLLKNAKERKVEREIILERKIAREQEQEEKNHEYMGKDKFVTKSYKKKLEEREEWIRKEELRKRKDEEEDVTKKDARSAMIGFYGNLPRIGAGAPANDDVDLPIGESRPKFSLTDSRSIRPSKSTSNYMENDGKYQSTTGNFDNNDDDDDDDKVQDVELESELSIQQMRIKRLQKIFLARERYLQRKAEREISQVSIHLQ